MCHGCCVFSPFLHVPFLQRISSIGELHFLLYMTGNLQHAPYSPFVKLGFGSSYRVTVCFIRETYSGFMNLMRPASTVVLPDSCLLYTSDAADE